LVRRRCTERGIDSEADDVALGEHGLDVPTAILREDKSTTSTLTGPFPGAEFNEVGIHRRRIDVEHELLGHLGDIGRFLLVFVIRIVLFLFFVLVLLALSP